MGIYKVKRTHLKNLKDGGIKEVIENIRIPAKDYESVIKKCREEKGLGRGKLAKESGIEEKTGIKVFIRNKKNNSGQVTFEYKDLDQLYKIINTIALLRVYYIFSRSSLIQYMLTVLLRTSERT